MYWKFTRSLADDIDDVVDIDGLGDDAVQDDVVEDIADTFDDVDDVVYEMVSVVDGVMIMTVMWRFAEGRGAITHAARPPGCGTTRTHSPAATLG